MASFLIEKFHTQSQERFDVQLVYRTLGKLNSNGDNVVVVTTSYAAQDDEAELLTGGENGIDLESYFVVFINMMSNGLSSSPSNTEPPFDGYRFPHITIYDNVCCQRKLIDSLGISRVRLVIGFSMGALQAFEWGSQHPDIVDAILPICGAARVSPHNWLFLDGAKAALELDPEFSGGDYDSPPEAGLRIFARIYAAWALSQTFFRDALYSAWGLNTVDEVVEFFYEYFARRDANDLLGMLWTWQNSDISNNTNFDCDFAAALGAITARAIVMPCSTDLYFTVDDSEIEVTHMPNAELRVITSAFGHLAGSGQVPEGKAMIDEAICDLLEGAA